MKDSQIVEAVYEREMLHPLTPLHGLKEMDRVRLQVWLAEETENPSAGLATLAGGWDDSDALAESATAVHRSRSAARPLPSFKEALLAMPNVGHDADFGRAPHCLSLESD